MKKEENFLEICKFIVELMRYIKHINLFSQNFENSFLQQIIDIIKGEENVFNQFVSCFFDKFLRGRNVTFTTNDVKFLIKHTLTFCGPFFYFEKLLNFIKSKNQGGARTTHQINQTFVLITYVIDLTINKINEEKNEDTKSAPKKSTVFKEKHLNLNSPSIQLFLQNIIEVIKENLKEEVSENPEEGQSVPSADPIEEKKRKLKEKELREAKFKSKNLYSNLINLTEKFLLFLIKAGVEINN